MAPKLLGVSGVSDPSRDLGERWSRARRAATAALIGAAAPDADEAEVLACASEVDEPSLHRRLFENGVRLGQGFGRFHRRQVQLFELPELLGSLGVPCLSGEWELNEQHRALRLSRAACRAGCTSAHCDAWREAIDGLTAGLVANGRLTRLASAGHGQPSCVDVFTDDPESPLRFGELADEQLEALEAVRRFVRLFKGTDVRFLGICEGVLFYRLETENCGELRGSAQELIEASVKRKLPGLQVRELSPRSVMDQVDQFSSPTQESP